MSWCIPLWALLVYLLIPPCLSQTAQKSQQEHTVSHDGRETIQLSDYDTMDGVIWVVQLSDIHISSFDPDRAASLQNLMGPLLSIIRPALVLITGDLTNAKSKDRTSRRQDKAEWVQYRRTITKVMEESGLPTYAFYDLHGNHDKFGVPQVGGELDFFSKYSVSSLRNRSNTVQSVTVLNKDWKHLFLGIDTAMEIGLRGPCNLFGHPTDDQLAIVDQELSQWENHTSERVTKVVFGHFPMSFTASTANRNRLEPIFAKHSISAYICGHLHKIFGTNLVKHHLHPHVRPMTISGPGTGEFWEWEMGDWRMCRTMRVLVIDQGHVSYVDFDLSNLNVSSGDNKDWLPTLIIPTYPLDSGKMERISSHHFSEALQGTVRALIISPRPIKSVFVKCYINIGELSIFIEEREMYLLSKTGKTTYMYASKLNITNYTDDKNYVFRVSVRDSVGIETDSSLRPFSVSRRVHEVKNTWTEYLVIGFVWEKAFVTLTWSLFTCLLASLIIPKILFNLLVQRGAYSSWAFSLFNDGTRKLDLRKTFEMLVWFFIQGSAYSATWWCQLVVFFWLMLLPWLWGHILPEGYPLGYMSIWGWTVHLSETVPLKRGLGWPDLMTVVLPYMFLVILPLHFVIFALSAVASVQNLHKVNGAANYKKSEKPEPVEYLHSVSRNSQTLHHPMQTYRHMRWVRIVLIILCFCVLHIHIRQVSYLAAAYGAISVLVSPGFAWPVPVLIVVAIINSFSSGRPTKHTRKTMV